MSKGTIKRAMYAAQQRHGYQDGGSPSWWDRAGDMLSYLPITKHPALQGLLYAMDPTPANAAEDETARQLAYGLRQGWEGTAETPVERKSGGKVYPLRNHTDWEEAQDYEKKGGKLTRMSPEEFLSKVEPLKMTAKDEQTIQHFMQQIRKGEKLDPVAILQNGHPNGRHRAHAAKRLGIKQIPVVTWSEKRGGGPVVKQALMLTLKKAKSHRGRPDNS